MIREKSAYVIRVQLFCVMCSYAMIYAFIRINQYLLYEDAWRKGGAKCVEIRG